MMAPSHARGNGRFPAASPGAPVLVSIMDGHGTGHEHADAGPAVRFAVETWAPEYGSSVDGPALDESDAAVDLAVECDADAWRPRRPASTAEAGGCVLFVDGVQRIDARVWVIDEGHTDGAPTGIDAAAEAGRRASGARQGVCASWAAGVVRCDARASVVAAEVRRGVLCVGPRVDTIATRHGDYRPTPVPESGGDPVSQALGRARGELEGRVAVAAMAGPAAAGCGDLLVVDGPLGDRRHIPGAIGYVKTHHVSYLPVAQEDVATSLAVGERTPLFTIGNQRFRYSWYLRLPGVAAHPWWGVVRCEASGDLSRAEAVGLADRVTATLPRFASRPHNDPRAPQNLYPIAGLERELRRRLGDPAILDRALRRAAAH